ncbi:alanine--tRNA ligase [Candidatus Caldatribacterium sp.]|uniref:alanine--tRNA ligase n=1 Tax=Candidatus Caldatribacterium sp. TaxID=2282143 RepID=UPI00383C3BD2|nr:alanine--tRNA ligase [Candidatus Caldatribacterium sp.]
MLESRDIRRLFLAFFEKRGHTSLPSASLIPSDPTLLLTIAGMVPFKPIFLGQVKPTFRRVCTVQKCVRVSDLEKVGYTPRHHTFFEMLGNFSFGDYFKKEACLWAWEFLTEELRLPVERLAVSVHERDEEAFLVWRDVVGLPEEKIVFLGDEDNFWASGPVGPCGYCSEIYYDTGAERGCGEETCRPGCACDRFLEVWNLVFMEFDRQSDGTLRELPSKNIDTGMGLERISAVVQNAESNFETDLFLPLIRTLEDLSGVAYASAKPVFRLIADHSRAVAFLIADGVYPANEGRGYVLRRLIRRAHRFGKKIGLQKPFLHELTAAVVTLMGDVYPELRTKETTIAQVTFQEEKRFEDTLALGFARLEELIAEARAKKERVISGKEVFTLYDTYGFPVDFAEEVLKEEGLSFSQEEFAAEMEAQRTRARRAQEEKVSGLRGQKKEEELFSGFRSTFVGYDTLLAEATLCALSDGEKLLSEAREGTEVLFVLDVTPFYAEKGGQEWDTGYFETPSGKVEVLRVSSPASSLSVHRGIVRAGKVVVGERGKAQVNAKRRRSLEAHHTVTHLLHRVLREVLGEQVHQAGSWVGEEGLRFDFTHFAPLSSEELEAVEARVNEKILEDLPVYVSFGSLEEAQKLGVIALFGEKYEFPVRIVRVGNYTAELCGGTHLRRTGEAGAFVILSESSIGAGIRRIEAVAGERALTLLRASRRLLQRVRELAGVSEERLPAFLENLLEENHALRKALAREQRERLLFALERELQALPAGSLLFAHLFADSLDMDILREIADVLGGKLSRGVIALGVEEEGKVRGILAGVKLAKDVHLGAFLREVSRSIGGGGGGKPHFAQFGGIPKSRWMDFLRRLEEFVKRHEAGHGP